MDNERHALETSNNDSTDSSDVIADLLSLPSAERRAFLAWFSGGVSHVTKYATRDHVYFGKAECEWVDFEEFWLKKLPSLGWIIVEEVRRFKALGMVGQPDATEYRFTVADKGVAVMEAYWNRQR